MRLYPGQLAPRGLREFKPPVTPRFLPLKNPKGKADEPRPTDTRAGRPPPRCSLTQHIAGAAARPSPVGTAAGPGRHPALGGPRSSGGRRSASGRPGAERSAVQLQGQRRRLLASVLLARVAAFGGRGVLWPNSRLWAPPPAAAAAPAARSLRVRAPHQAARAPQVAAEGRSALGRALCGPRANPGRRSQPRSRRRAPGTRQGRGTAALTPTIQSAASSPAGN